MATSNPTPSSTRRRTSTYASGASLTQITYFARNALVICLVLFIVLLMGKLAYDNFLSYLGDSRCRQPDKTNPLFGYLPPITFSAQSVILKPNAYALNLSSRSIGNSDDPSQMPTAEVKDQTLPVFAVIRPTSDLASDRRARDIASSFGFNGEPTFIDGETYRWNRGGSNFEINRRTLALNYDTDFLNNSEYLNRAGKTLPTNDQAAQLTKNTLREIDLLPDDVASAPADIVFLKALGNELAPVNSISEADFIQVALTREAPTRETTDIHCRPVTKEYPFFQPIGVPSSIVAIIARDYLDNDHLVEMSFHYQALSSPPNLYKARSLEEAWQVVQSGEAYIVNRGTSNTATITDFRIGLYESATEQSYFQPIYIFTGPGGFMAYVPALDQTNIDANQLLQTQIDNPVIPRQLGETATVSATPTPVPSPTPTPGPTPYPTPRPAVISLPTEEQD